MLHKYMGTFIILFVYSIVAPIMTVVMSIVTDYVMTGASIFYGDLMYLFIISIFVILIIPYLVFNLLKELPLSRFLFITLANLILYPLVLSTLYTNYLHASQSRQLLFNTFSFDESTFILLGILLSLHHYLLGLRATKS